jgi:DNA-directed RNA polymerase subunit RPC12/RpoP
MAITEFLIQCPYCNHQHEDIQEYVDPGDMDGEFPMKCNYCGEFRVEFSTVITFKSSKEQGGDDNG